MATPGVDGTRPQDAGDVDVVVVGAGFAGLYQLHRLREAGFTSRAFEAGSDVGGTWYWNRYPGARCDVPSMEYSFSFDDDLQAEWDWTEKYATQPEILAYLQAVADRFDLRDGITFDTRVVAAAFDESTSTWTVTTERTAGSTDGSGAGDGDHGAESVRCRYLVMATGCLSVPLDPHFEGLDDFVGDRYWTSRWPHDGVDFSGRKVGVIGTGSSAIQSIPIIAEQAAHLTVFQRTPNYTVPAHNEPLDPAQVAAIKADYGSFRDANRAEGAAFGSHVPRNEDSALAADEPTLHERFEKYWAIGGLPFMRAFSDLGLSLDANEKAAEFVRGKIAEIVTDPDTAAKLTPTQAIACKRLCVDSGYWATFNRPHVDLVDLRDTPIRRFTADGIETDAGLVDLDAVVFATGFDAMTGALARIDLTGRGGLPLREKWAAGPANYLGIQTVGFPNLFTITGPGSPSVLTNMVMSIEHHVDFVTDALVRLRDRGLSTIEPEADAESMWVQWVNDVADLTIYPHCNSWYLGANVPGKPRVFMPVPGFPTYVEQVAAVVRDGYRGFVLA